MKTEPTFVLIDDNPIDIIIHKFMFKSELKKPANITHFSNGQEGLRYIEKTHSTETKNKTILLMDIGMSEMNNREFLSHFGEFDKKIKDQVKIFILSTSLNQKEIDKISTNPHVYKFLSKPLSEKNIAEIIFDVTN
jgi:CheY-like chemotaxis protein